jgi:hypothetical protein
MPATHRRIKILCALALAAGFSAHAPCASIDGTIGFPSEYVPAMQVYARDVDTSHLASLATRQDQIHFRFELPVGRYVFFAVPDEPGAPEIYGAHTSYSDCLLRDPKGECSDHTLAIVALSAGRRAVNVKLDDWFLPDETADDLDRIRGITATPSADELGAPHFSEYPISRLANPTAPPLAILPEDLSAAERNEVLRSMSGGPNFAGHVTVAELACGAACRQLLLIDWRSGKLIPKGTLPKLGELPCRGAEATRFRRDSRLLSITRSSDNSIVTEYFIWKPESASLTQTAEYRRTPERFCAQPAH